ncbi:LacI family DNA-binding transcriptional regulator [Streptomyces mirabilis]
MARRPTIADVAQLAGVSRATVSFVLNNRPGVALATRQRVRSAAEELGWTPSRSARALSTGRARAVGLVLTREPELIGTDPFYPAFMAGIEAVISETGDGLMLQMSRPGDEVETYRRLAADQRVDGVFLTDLRQDDPRPALVTELGLPAVAVGAVEADTDLPTVNLDDRPAVRSAVRHLIELGHRDIAHVAGPEDFVHARRRRQAWADALAEAGLPSGTSLPGGFTAEGGAQATRALLARSSPHRHRVRQRLVGHGRYGGRPGSGPAAARGPLGGRLRRCPLGVLDQPSADDLPCQPGLLGPGRRPGAGGDHRARHHS